MFGPSVYRHLGKTMEPAREMMMSLNGTNTLPYSLQPAGQMSLLSRLTDQEASR